MLRRQFSSTARRFDVAKMTLVGRIGQNLEPKEGPKAQYLQYPLAVRTGKEETSWFNIVVFDQPAIDFMTKYLKSGSLVYVEADASRQKYVDKDGNNKSSLNLIQSSIAPVGWKKSDSGESSE